MRNLKCFKPVRMNLTAMVFFALLLATGAQTFAQSNPNTAQNLPTIYNVNGGFENGKAGYYSYKNTAQAIPVNGSGSGATTTITASTTAPISGKSSGIISHPGTNAQGEGIAVPFTTDKAARGKSISISGKYEIVSGTYNGGTSQPYTDSDVEVYVYDLDASQVIQPATLKLDGGVQGYTYDIGASFQPTNINSTHYLLLFHNATTTTSAFSIRIDSLQVSLVTKSYGSPITDLVSAGVNQISATTGAVTKGTTTNDVVRIGRRGDHAIIKGEYKQTSAGGGVTNADILITLPNSLSFDSSKVSFYTGALNTNGTSNWPTQVGLGTATVNNTSSSLIGMVIPYDATHFRIAGDYNSGSSATAGFLGSTFGIATSTLTWSYDFEAPIAGWSSTTQMSDAGTTAATVATYGVSTAQSVSPGAVIKYDTRLSDSTLSYSSTTGLFTANSNGNFRLNITAASNGNGFLYYKISGAPGANLAYVANNGYPVSASASFPLQAGQTVGIYLDPSASAQTFLAPSATFGYLNTVSFEKVATPQTVAASDSVISIYGLTTAQAVAANGVIKYDTKVKDSCACYSTATGLYTAQISGTYKISAVGFAGSTVGNIYVKVGGNGVGGLFATGNITNGSISYPVLAGQTIGVYSDTAMTMTATYSFGFSNQVSIERTGNY